MERREERGSACQGHELVVTTLDEIFFVDLPNEAERLEIFQIHLTLHQQRSDKFDLPRLVAATAGFSRAEIEQVVITSLYRALYLKLPLDTEMLLQEIEAKSPCPCPAEKTSNIGGNSRKDAL